MQGAGHVLVLLGLRIVGEKHEGAPARGCGFARVLGLVLGLVLACQNNQCIGFIACSSLNVHATGCNLGRA